MELERLSLVTVEPTTAFDLYDGQWTHTTRIFVQNRTDSPVYSVFVEIAVQTKGVPASSLKFEADDRDTQVGEIPGYKVRTDFLVLFGSRDNVCDECLWVIFPVIPPHVMREIRLTGTVRRKSTAIARLVGVDRKPSGGQIHR